jgi:ABC-2 type transport system ATP-binding protein
MVAIVRGSCSARGRSDNPSLGLGTLKAGDRSLTRTDAFLARRVRRELTLPRTASTVKRSERPFLSPARLSLLYSRLHQGCLTVIAAVFCMSDTHPLLPAADVDALPLVAVDEVSKSFGAKTALRNVSFSVPSGQICGLLGPNGAGKTTLFRLLMGILKASSGRMLIDSLDAFEDRVAAKRIIGFLPDEPVFYSYLSGREVLELSAAMHGLNVPQTMMRVGPLIAQLRLSDDIDNYAEDYSRGMKKKLGLLLAMLHQPKLLVLDEPTNGLDVESTHLFYDLISTTARGGVTVLFSTHLMDHVTRLCSHAVIINEGTVVAKGSIGDLRTQHVHSASETLEDIFLRLTTRPAQS